MNLKSPIKDKKNWTSFVKYILNKLDMGYVFDSTDKILKGRLIKSIKKKLELRFNKKWNSTLFEDSRTMNQGNKLRTYRKFKTSFHRENYLNLLQDKKIRSSLCQFRISAHQLNIETGRYKKIPLHQRTCKSCPLKIEDEIHFLTECSLFTDARTLFFNKISKINKHFNTHSNENKFIWLMSNEDPEVLKLLADFVYESFNKRGRACHQ